MKTTDLNSLEKHSAKASEIENARNSIIAERKRIANLKFKCVSNGICPDCGGKITGTSRSLYSGLFKRKVGNSHNIAVHCRNCTFRDWPFPIEAANFNIIYA